MSETTHRTCCFTRICQFPPRVSEAFIYYWKKWPSVGLASCCLSLRGPVAFWDLRRWWSFTEANWVPFPWVWVNCETRWNALKQGVFPDTTLWSAFSQEKGPFLIVVRDSWQILVWELPSTKQPSDLVKKLPDLQKLLWVGHFHLGLTSFWLFQKRAALSQSFLFSQEIDPRPV